MWCEDWEYLEGHGGNRIGRPRRHRWLGQLGLRRSRWRGGKQIDGDASSMMREAVRLTGNDSSIAG